MTRQEAEARVAKGASLLDRIEPGWHKRINLKRFQLTEPCLCVLGQLYGNYYKCVRDVFLSNEDTDEQADAHGFYFQQKFGLMNLDVVTAVYELLQDAWIEAISDRLVPQVPIRKDLPESVEA